MDKFYLCAVERKWHSSCLKCVECGAELENEASCFEKEGHIYCRDDYLRYHINKMAVNEEYTNILAQFILQTRLVKPRLVSRINVKRNPLD